MTVGIAATGNCELSTRHPDAVGSWQPEHGLVPPWPGNRNRGASGRRQTSGSSCLGHAKRAQLAQPQTQVADSCAAAEVVHWQVGHSVGVMSRDCSSNAAMASKI